MSPGTLFWDVDTQADFMIPGGRLYVPGAESIIATLGRLTAYALENGITILASADAHRQDDPEFAHYPPHCLAGTPGQQKIPETRVSNALVVPNRAVEELGVRGYQQIVFEKQQLDVFTNPNVDAVLAQLAPIAEVVLYGVVTELCVAFALRGLARRGYRVRIVTDAVQHLDESQARAFFDEARRLGGTEISSSKLIGENIRQRA